MHYFSRSIVCSRKTLHLNGFNIKNDLHVIIAWACYF